MWKPDFQQTGLLLEHLATRFEQESEAHRRRQIIALIAIVASGCTNARDASAFLRRFGIDAQVEEPK